MDQKGDWLALGLGHQVWILKLHWNAKCEIHKVDHYATFEGHRSSMSGLHIISEKSHGILTLSKKPYGCHSFFLQMTRMSQGWSASATTEPSISGLLMDWNVSMNLHFLDTTA